MVESGSGGGAMPAAPRTEEPIMDNGRTVVPPRDAAMTSLSGKAMRHLLQPWTPMATVDREAHDGEPRRRDLRL
jgi:hypothetical protein